MKKIKVSGIQKPNCIAEGPIDLSDKDSNGNSIADLCCKKCKKGDCTKKCEIIQGLSILSNKIRFNFLTI